MADSQPGSGAAATRGGAVGEVHVHPEPPTAEEMEAAAIEQQGWSVVALGLGIGGVVLAVLAMILILQGVFTLMPNK